MTAVAELARIRGQFERIRALTGDARLFTINEKISGWSSAEHLDHLLKVAKSVFDRLPSDEVLPRGISFTGRCVLACRWIPRGVGKTPERLAGKQCTLEELEARFGRVSTALEALDTAAVDAARNPNVPHPRFGGLTPSQALRFVTIHNAHHLKIVGDILR
ncbi:MAG TPA: DinB family protein [Thermoanaerobaculia bacterium]|nr:DinB family protein [Thermoanaerobaculia bacterium]